MNQRTDPQIKLAGSPRTALQIGAEHQALTACIAGDLLAREPARKPNEGEQKIKGSEADRD